MQVKLVFQSGPRSGEEVSVDHFPFYIGRAADCALRLDQDLVAERHCRLTIQGDRIKAEDLDSPHGTVVNHQLVTTAELHDGDRLRIGPVRFMISIITGLSRSANPAPPQVRGEDLPPLAHGGIGFMDSVPDSPATQIARALLDQMTHKKVHGKEYVHLRLGEADGITLVELVAKGKAFVEYEEISRLESELSALIIDGHERLVVNLKNIDRLSSSAISALLELHRLAMSRGGRLKLCKARPLVAEMLRAVGAHKRLEMFQDEWHAVSSEWPEQSVIELEESMQIAEPKRYSQPLKAEPPPLDSAPEEPAPAASPAPAIVRRTPANVPLVGEPEPGAAPATTVRLKVLVGRSQGKEIELNQPRFVIGRDPKCQLRPSSEAISRLHTRIDQRDGKVFVRDLGAANGTIVNDNPLHAREVEVFNGDRLEIGPLVFEFSIKPRTPAFKTAVEDEVASWVLEEGNAGANDTTAYFMPVYQDDPDDTRRMIHPPKDGGEYDMVDSD